ncbi:D-galactarolactone cycloisomerase [Seinonella peptonophila]|uniref:D-galactarolactone cycloisomerase n=1 Tax=Seinonella peptonophila TaxID=112248 RepID=A0A1M5AEY4_9BACL|nr:mandelate racemase/muconate lactonizing enzyme family protein [Seinonella peptonophila]SHF28656.1 D-galactarolactone cycloisomerase [Seinonella peptonophila]
MIIKQIDTFPLFYRLKEPYGDANGYKYYRTCYLFRIRTQSGIEGWGECIDWLPTLEKGFRDRVIPFLLGKKVTDRAHLITTIQKWHDRIASGVSMALTEILAKIAGLSVCDLWGGKRREVVPVYASFQSYSEDNDWINQSIKKVETVADAGFQKMKIKIGGKSFLEDARHISSLVKLFEGQIQFALDANQSYDLFTALKWNAFFEKSSCWLWFEEPVPLQNHSAYSLLRSRCHLPIAGGENIQKPNQFIANIQAGSFDIIQPDPMHVMNIDTFRNILQLARYQKVRVSPHTYDGILSRFYAILAQSCLPAWSKMEGEEIEPVEWDVMENPFTTLLPVDPIKGIIKVPSGVGIGVEFDEKQLESLRWDGSSY